MASRPISVKNLSHAGGVISALINGVSRSVVLPVLSANTLYMLYYTSSGLVVSTNFNSVGPAGFSGWVLVGAFYSSGKAVPDFGCFMTIDGVPTSVGFVDSGPIISTVHLVANISPTFTSTTYNSMRWRRKGRQLFHDWELSMIALGTSGSGAYRLVLPFTPDPLEHTPFGFTGTEDGSASALQRALMSGQGHMTNGSFRGRMTPFLFNTNQFGLLAEAVFTGWAAWSNSFFDFGGSQSFRINLKDVSISGWNDTPLKDL
jgi:hypothetical protein